MAVILAVFAALAALITQASETFDTETEQPAVYAEAEQPEAGAYAEAEQPEPETGAYAEAEQPEPETGAYAEAEQPEAGAYAEAEDGAVYSEVGPSDETENPWLEPGAMARSREAYESSPEYGGYGGDTAVVTEEGPGPYSDETKAAMEQCLADLADDPEAQAVHCRL